MYLVKKHNRKTNQTFDTYEQARQWIRKQLRKIESFRLSGQPDCFMSDFGYTIVKTH